MKLIILIIMITAFALNAEDAKPIPLTISVQNALVAYEKEVVSARKVYDTATTKAQGNALEKLEKEKISLMQKGDLDGATALANAIKSLNSGETLMAIEDNVKKQSSPLNQMVNPLVGKWQLIGTPYINEFKENGTALSPVDNNTGKWTINGNKIVVIWAGGVVQTYILPVKNSVISGTTNKGGTCTLVKIQDAR